jgi:multiple sugar transport system permease protein
MAGQDRILARRVSRHGKEFWMAAPPWPRRRAVPRWNSASAEETRAGWLAISPWIIGFAIFTLGPILASLYFSLNNYNVIQPARFVGLENYRRIFTDDPLFLKSLLNTLVYTVLYVPLHVFVAMGAAMLLSRAARLQGIFRTLFYLPAMTPAVATSLLWLWILNPNDGIINRFLRFLHLPAPAWTVDPFWMKPAVVIMSTWVIGGSMLIFLAGLKDIPVMLYEAAEIDGASPWQQFRYITFPLLSSVTFFIATISTISALQTFTQGYIMFDKDGGNQNAALFYVMYLFKRAFEYFQMGYASALAWLLFLVIAVLTAIQFVVAKRWVYYDTER